MKKIIGLCMVLLNLAPLSIFAESNLEKPVTIKEIPKQDAVSSTTYEVLVYATNTVDDLCNYFNGSWADVGLTIYCKFGGDVYICTAHKIVSVACGMNGVVRLAIEGDYDAALRKALITATKVFNVTKENGKFVIR